MAVAQKSKRFSGSNGQWYELKIKLEEVGFKRPQIGVYETTIHAEVWLISRASTASITWYGSGRPLSLDICGVHETVHVDPNLGGGQSKLLFAKNYKVNNAYSVSGSAVFDGSQISWLGSADVSVDLTLTVFSFVSDNIVATLGEPVMIELRDISSAGTYDIRYEFGRTTGTIVTGVSSTYYWTPPLSLANLVTESETLVGKFIVRRRFGTSYTEEDQGLLTIKVPRSVVPTIGQITATELNNDVYQVLGANRFLQLLSNIRVALVNVVGAYGSRIINQTIRVGSTTYNGNTVDVNNIQESGTVTITGTVTDSRNRTATKSITVNLLPYTRPQITAFLPTRTGNGTNTAVQATIIASAKHILLNNANKNRYKVVVHRSERNQNNWEKVYESESTIEEFTRTVSLGINYVSEKSYDLRLTIIDKFNQQQTAIVTISTIDVVMALGVNNVGVGKIPDENRTLDVKGTTQSSQGFFKGDKPIQHYQLTRDNGLLIETDQWNLPWEFDGTHFGWRSSSNTSNPTKDWGLLRQYHLDSKRAVQFFSSIKSGRLFTRTANNTSSWQYTPWKEIALVEQREWISTGKTGVFYKRQGDLVTIRLNFVSERNGNNPIGRIPREFLPHGQMMLLISRWSVHVTDDKHLQINADGGLHILNDSSGAEYRTQVQFSI